MDLLHKSEYDADNLELEEGQRTLLCSNKASLRCPSLCYEPISAPSDAVDRAFDLLFEEVLCQEDAKQHDKTHINLRTSIDIATGRGADHPNPTQHSA